MSEENRIEINKSVIAEWVKHPITKERMLRIGPAKGSVASMLTQGEAWVLAGWLDDALGNLVES
jgi:hypothetical protein